MKKFTCKEMGGPCDAVIEGETMEDVMKSGGDHVNSTKDEAHEKLVADMNDDADGEKMKKWTGWFKGEWDKKEEA